ncbi:MAG TPA: hypothetical protein VL049_04865 [Candidatus Dormibacteraeota bacterium]|nr:hypothetical protein [Candidatus Dormibacteraeota bacterium]
MQTEPGDLILVKSTEAIFAFGRWLGGNPYDHVAVVVDGGQTINIDKPMIRSLPVARLLRPELQPLVLRPTFQSAQQRAAFVGWIQSLAARSYDTARTLGLVGRLLLRRALHWAPPMEPPRPEQERWICTDAVLLGLETHAAGFSDIQSLPLDWVRLRCGTTNDLLYIARVRPDLLAAVA